MRCQLGGNAEVRTKKGLRRKLYDREEENSFLLDKQVSLQRELDLASEKVSSAEKELFVLRVELAKARGETVQVKKGADAELFALREAAASDRVRLGREQLENVNLLGELQVEKRVSQNAIEQLNRDMEAERKKTREAELQTRIHDDLAESWKRKFASAVAQAIRVKREILRVADRLSGRKEDFFALRNDVGLEDAVRYLEEVADRLCNVKALSKFPARQIT
jgi:hypothetical protein